MYSVSSPGRLFRLAKECKKTSLCSPPSSWSSLQTNVPLINVPNPNLTHNWIILFNVRHVNLIWCSNLKFHSDSRCSFFLQLCFCFSRNDSQSLITSYNLPTWSAAHQVAFTLITSAGAISQRLPERSEFQAKISNSISERTANLYVSTSHIAAFATHQEWRSTDHLLKPSAPCWGTAGFSLRSSSISANCWSDIFSCFHLLFSFFWQLHTPRAKTATEK